MKSGLGIPCTVNEQNSCIDAFVQSAGLSLDEHRIPILFKKDARVADHITLCK